MASSALATIHLISDLHLEFDYDPESNRTGDHSSFAELRNPYQFLTPEGLAPHILVLAGDIGHPTEEWYRDFLKEAKSKYDEVIVVAGNHEFYSRGLKNTGHKRSQRATVDQVIACAREAAEQTGCHFLNRDAVTLELNGEAVTFLGTTLWSYIDPRDYSFVADKLNDFRNICPSHHPKGPHRLTPSMYSAWHKRDLNWLQGELSSRKAEAVVVVTHYCPTQKIIAPMYQGHPLNMCFVTDLEYLFEDPVRLWLCGHSHKRGVAEINSRLCALEPRGYPGENQETKPLRFYLFKGGKIKLISASLD